MAWHLCYTTRYVYVACAVYGCSGRVVVNSVLTDIAIRTFDFTFLSRACASYSSARSSTRHICVFGAGRNSLCAICHALNETTINGRSAIWLWNSSAWIVLSFRKQGNYNEKKSASVHSVRCVRDRNRDSDKQITHIACASDWQLHWELCLSTRRLLKYANAPQNMQLNMQWCNVHRASRIANCHCGVSNIKRKISVRQSVDGGGGWAPLFPWQYKKKHAGDAVYLPQQTFPYCRNSYCLRAQIFYIYGRTHSTHKVSHGNFCMCAQRHIRTSAKPSNCSSSYICCWQFCLFGMFAEARLQPTSGDEDYSKDYTLDH